MKNKIAFLGLLIIVVGLFVNSNLLTPDDVEFLSDEQIVSLYLEEEYGNDDREVVVYESEDPEYINYYTYTDNDLTASGSVKRSYATYIITH